MPYQTTLDIKMKRNSSLNTTYLSQDGVRLSNYMFRPAFVAIVRLQFSSFKSYTVCLKVRVMMRSQSCKIYNLA